jgi:integrase
MRGTKVELSPGVWRFRVFVGSDTVTGNPRQVSRTFRGSKRQADSALAAFVTEVVAGTVPATSPLTMAEYIDRWIEYITPTRSSTTIRGYKAKAKRITAQLGSTRLDRVTAQHLDRAYHAWLSEGLDPSSVHHLHRVLSAALSQAVKWGLIPSSPTAKSSPPRRRTQPQCIPSVDTIHHLIDAAEDHGQPILATAIALAATTGLRRGELAGLQWDDVDLERRRLEVRRSIKNDLDGGWVAGPPKTHQERRIALDDFTVEVLSRHRARAERWAADARTALAPSGYALTFDPSGTTPMKPDSIGQAFSRLCDKEGIDGLTLHSLRHFSASMLIASGRDVRTIAGRLGHSDATTTLRVYAHVVDGRDQDAADFLGALLGSGQAAALHERRPVDPVQPPNRKASRDMS